MFEIHKVVKKGDYMYAVCPDHPRRTKNNYVLLHRVVVENAIGRLLADNEVVHHKDHNRFNNSPDNLEVMTRSAHAKLHGAERHRSVTVLTCHFCGVEFERYSNLLGGRTRAFCSRSCNAKHSRHNCGWTHPSTTVRQPA